MHPSLTTWNHAVGGHCRPVYGELKINPAVVCSRNSLQQPTTQHDKHQLADSAPEDTEEEPTPGDSEDGKIPGSHTAVCL